MDEVQAALCKRIGSEFRASPPQLKVGLAIQTIGKQPINGLRHLPEGDTTGWYIWSGEELESDADFFQPVHAGHLAELLPGVIQYLGLAPGWRFQVASGHEDVWFDGSLLDIL